MIKSNRLFNCLRCGRQVIICPTCDRGNVYCGQVCARLARRNAQRSAGHRYQNTYQGKLKHAARQRHYRQRQAKKVTHQGSIPQPTQTHCSPAKKHFDDSMTGTSCYCCHFCGGHPTSYLRRHFLRPHWAVVKSLTRAPPPLSV